MKFLSQVNSSCGADQKECLEIAVKNSKRIKANQDEVVGHVDESPDHLIDRVLHLIRQDLIGDLKKAKNNFLNIVHALLKKLSL